MRWEEGGDEKAKERRGKELGNGHGDGREHDDKSQPEYAFADISLWEPRGGLLKSSWGLLGIMLAVCSLGLTLYP